MFIVLRAGRNREGKGERQRDRKQGRKVVAVNEGPGRRVKVVPLRKAEDVLPSGQVLTRTVDRLGHRREHHDDGKATA